MLVAKKLNPITTKRKFTDCIETKKTPFFLCGKVEKNFRSLENRLNGFDLVNSGKLVF